MNRKPFSTSLLYGLATLFILGWWGWAFQTTPSFQETSQHSSHRSSTHELLNKLSPLQREELHQALAGNTRLMLELIDRWEQDGQFLSNQAYLQAHLLGKLLEEEMKGPLPRLLPQTDMGASILLAIADPKQLIALPIGIRKHPHIYGRWDEIPFTLPYMNSEELFLAKPEGAIISRYSHPDMKERLRRQGIPLYVFNDIDKIEAIKEAIIQAGEISRHPLKAQLLTIFMDAAFLAIDHRISALYQAEDPVKNILYLYRHHHYSVPTSKCLAGQLMQRAIAHHPGFAYSTSNDTEYWHVPVDQETIVQAKPDYLLIAAKQAREESLLACGSAKIFYLDEYIQESPSQYIVLAYFDIFQALHDY